MISKFFIALLCVFLIQDVTCIKCFTCRSDVDPKCADPFDNSTVPITDCNQVSEPTVDAKSTICRKLRQKVNGELVYLRGCAFPSDVTIQSDQGLCFTSTNTDNIAVEYCTCNHKDGCNSSTVFNPKPLLMIFAFMSIMYKKA